MKKGLILLIFNISFLFAFGNTLQDSEMSLFLDTFETQVEIVEPKEATIVQNMKILNIDPALMSEDYSKRIIPFVYETLFTIDKDGNIEKNLVEDYKWITERKLYIKIKDNILFHDNSKLSAKDVKISLEFLKENGVLNRIYSEIRDIKIQSENELIIKIAEEDEIFLNSLTYDISAIVKRDNKGIYGTGKYKVVRSNGKETILNRFENFHGKKAKLEKIIFTWEIDRNQRLIDFFNGSANLIANMEEAEINEGKKLGIISPQDIVSPSKVTVTKALIFGKKYNYSLEERKALDIIIPKKAKSFFPESFLEANLSKFKDVNDERELKEFAKKLEKREEIELMVLNTESDIEEAHKIKNSLKKYGIKIKILPHNIESYNKKINSEDYEIAISNMTTENNDLPLLITTILLNDVKNINIYNALIPFFEMLKIENNSKNREKIVDKMTYLIYQNVPYIVLDHYKYYTVTTPNFIGLLDEIRKLNSVKGVISNEI